MSIQAVGWVLDHSQAKGITRLVLISLANHANQNALCWPSQRTIAREAGISKSSISECVSRLVALGELEVVDKGDSHRTAKYRLLGVGAQHAGASAQEVGAAPSPGVDAAPSPGVGRIINNRKEPSGASSPQVVDNSEWKRGDEVPQAPLKIDGFRAAPSDPVTHSRKGQSNATGSKDPTGRFPGELQPWEADLPERDPNGKGKATEALEILRSRYKSPKL